MAYESSIREYEGYLSNYRDKLDEEKVKCLKYITLNGKYKDLLKKKDDEIEELVQKVMQIRIDQAEEMNSLVAKFNSFELKSKATDSEDKEGKKKGFWRWSK